VDVRTARTKRDSEAEGIHLKDPTKSELQNAIGEAQIRGFSTVWIEIDSTGNSVQNP
jgi:hypothetical protein